MTVTNTTNTVEEAGNGSKTAFTFDFKAQVAADLKVFKVDTTTLVATLQTITTDYTVALNTTTEGGTVTYITAPTTGENSFIKREMTLDQQTDVPTEGNIPEDSLNDEYDKSRMIDIQLNEALNRSIKFAETSSLTDITFPESTSADARAGKTVLWNSAGTDLTLATPTSVSLIAATGDMEIGDSSGNPSVLSIGSTNAVLHVSGGTAVWATTLAGLTLTTPTIGSFANATHDHTNAAGGGTVEGTAIASTGETGGTKFLREDGDNTCSWQALSGTLQIVNVTDSAFATGTTVMVNDDTIPQNTEGDEVMTLAITPQSATSKLKIDVTYFGASNSAGGVGMAVALFQDSTADALASIMQQTSGANETVAISFTHFMTSGTTSATTFKVRGGGLAGTHTFNGAAAARIFGGVASSSITITEILN